MGILEEMDYLDPFHLSLRLEFHLGLSIETVLDDLCRGYEGLDGEGTVSDTILPRPSLDHPGLDIFCLCPWMW